MKYFLLVILLVASNAYSCSCVLAFNSPEVFEDEYRNSDIVAVGKARKTEWDESEHGYVSTVEIVDTWKGNDHSKFVETVSVGDCTASPEVGKTFYIFANRRASDGLYDIRECGYTHEKNFFNKNSRFIARELRKRGNAQ